MYNMVIVDATLKHTEHRGQGLYYSKAQSNVQ